MRIGALILCLAVAIQAPLMVTATDGQTVEFSVPGTTVGETEVTGAEWLLLVATSGNSSTLGSFQSTSNDAYTFHNQTVAEAKVDGVMSFAFPSESDSGPHRMAALDVEFATLGGPVVIYVEAESIRVGLGGKGKLGLTLPARCLDEFAGPDPHPSVRVGHYCPWVRGPYVSQAGEEGFTQIRAFGVTRLEYHGLHPSCVNSGPCLPEAGSSTAEHTVGSHSVGVTTISNVNVAAGGGTLELETRPSILAAGGEAINLSVIGWARLPRATGLTDCANCRQDPDQTLWIEGDVILGDLRAVPDSRSLSAVAGGTATSVRLDETYLDPSAWNKAAVAATAAGIGLTVLFWKLGAAALFHRVTPDRALEHPRRKRIMRYVEGHPGATFREVSRATELSAGTLRHHLNVMRRLKLLMERPHRATIRIFPNHGLYDRNWDEVVLLREEPLSRVHAFVAAHPDCIQSTVLDHFQALGWSRSTTQHRLQRLAQAGLLDVAQQGRRKAYCVRSERRVGLEAVPVVWAGRLHENP